MAYVAVLRGMREGSLPSVRCCRKPGLRRSNPGASRHPSNKLASGTSGPSADSWLCAQGIPIHVDWKQPHDRLASGTSGTSAGLWLCAQ